MFFYIFYICIFSVVTFYLFANDKKRARNQMIRIPELILLEMSAIGGAIGAYFAMHIYHHKTQKNKFRISIPVFIILHIIIFIIIVLKT